MCSTRSCLLRAFLVFLVGLLIAQGVYAAGSSFPVTVTDTGGKTAHLKDVPKRVVSLVPGATETFFALGAGDLIVGLTYHDTYPREAATKTIVGGFFDPSPELIEKLKPDVILLSSLQAKIRERFAEFRNSIDSGRCAYHGRWLQDDRTCGKNHQQERRSGSEDQSNTKAA